jgi:hypothetical protein
VKKTDRFGNLDVNRRITLKEVLKERRYYDVCWIRVAQDNAMWSSVGNTVMGNLIP